MWRCACGSIQMDSKGWTRCFWCPYWVKIPYQRGANGMAVCFWCFAGMEQCYWCSYWVSDPYKKRRVFDSVEKPLCNNCFEWYLDERGGPYQPSAQQRTTTRLQFWFPTLTPVLCREIAAMLRTWHEP